MSNKEIFTVSEISFYLKLSPSRIQQLTKKGIIPRESWGRYRLADVVEAYTEYLKAEIRRCRRDIKENQGFEIIVDT